MNKTGVLEWQQSIGGNNYDEGIYVQLTLNGGYIIVGNICSNEISGYHIPVVNTCGDIWIIKLSNATTNASKPVVSIKPASTNICANSATTFIASVLYAGPNPTYAWKKNNTAVGTNSPTYTAAGAIDIFHRRTVHCCGPALRWRITAACTAIHTHCELCRFPGLR